MRVLITVQHAPPQRYLVNLLTKSLIEEVKNLINNKKHSEALTVAFTKGVFVREIFEHEVGRIGADLLLCEKNARWDLMKSR